MMRKMIAIALIFLLSFGGMGKISAAPYTVEQTYRILQITAEEFINQLKSKEISEEEISSFLKDLGQKLSQQESLTEENFNSLMFTAMSDLLQSGAYNNLYIAMVSLYSEAFQVMLTTKTIPEEFQPLYQTVKTCLLGTGELQLFEDVPNDHWAKDSVQQLVADGIVNGMGNRLFAPEDTVTREQFLKMAVDCLGLKGEEGKPTPFIDLESGSWYLPYVSAAYEYQLVSGLEANRFGVGESMLRQDMAVIIYRILQKQNVSLVQSGKKLDQFQDQNQIDSYALEAVTYLCGGGLISGMSETTFAPRHLVTRAQAARMIAQMQVALSANHK